MVITLDTIKKSSNTIFRYLNEKNVMDFMLSSIYKQAYHTHRPAVQKILDLKISKIEIETIFGPYFGFRIGKKANN